MEPTTGLILRRITQTELSVSAHKLATIILDGIAWKEGYNGLSAGRPRSPYLRSQKKWAFRASI